MMRRRGGLYNCGMSEAHFAISLRFRLTVSRPASMQRICFQQQNAVPRKNDILDIFQLGVGALGQVERPAAGSED